MIFVFFLNNTYYYIISFMLLICNMYDYYSKKITTLNSSNLDWKHYQGCSCDKAHQLLYYLEAPAFKTASALKKIYYHYKSCMYIHYFF